MLTNSRFLNYFYKYKRKCVSCAQTILPSYKTTTSQAVKCSATKANNLKILFFGTDNFSLPTLKALHESKSCAALGTVTSFKSPANCVRLYAESSQLKLHAWPITSEICRDYDLGVVVSFGHLIPEHIIKAFPLGMINVHASLLPRWRGAAPIIYAIMHGDAVTGVSIMRIEPKHFDIGDILAQRDVAIRKNILMPELHAHLANEGAALLTETLQDFQSSLRNARKQSAENATFAPKVTASIAEVNWSHMDAQQLYNCYRALYSYRHLTTSFQGKNVQLIEVSLPETGGTALATRTRALAGCQPGAFHYQRERKCLLVCCANNSYIEVRQLRIEGKRVMSAMEFNNGFLQKQCGDKLLFLNKNVC